MIIKNGNWIDESKCACRGKYFTNKELCQPCEYTNLSNCVLVQRYTSQEKIREQQSWRDAFIECGKAFENNRRNSNTLPSNFGGASR